MADLDEVTQACVSNVMDPQLESSGGAGSRGPYRKKKLMSMEDLMTLLPGHHFFQFMR